MNLFQFIVATIISILPFIPKKHKKTFTKKFKKIFNSYEFQNGLKSIFLGLNYFLVLITFVYSSCTITLMLLKGHNLYTSFAVGSMIFIAPLNILYRSHKLVE